MFSVRIMYARDVLTGREDDYCDGPEEWDKEKT